MLDAGAIERHCAQERALRQDQEVGRANQSGRLCSCPSVARPAHCIFLCSRRYIVVIFISIVGDVVFDIFRFVVDRDIHGPPCAFLGETAQPDAEPAATAIRGSIAVAAAYDDHVIAVLPSCALASVCIGSPNCTPVDAASHDLTYCHDPAVADILAVSRRRRRCWHRRGWG